MADTKQPEAQEANRALWVAALRSGKYKQGKQLLNRDGEYCCLGVACEVAMEHGLALDKVVDMGSTFYNGSSGVAPQELQDWLGLINSTGRIKDALAFGGGGVGSIVSLVEMNDTGYTFEDIANYIEKGGLCVQSATASRAPSALDFGS